MALYACTTMALVHYTCCIHAWHLHMAHGLYNGFPSLDLHDASPLADLVKEFEAALDQDAMGLSEAVAAIQTLLQFIRNCKGMKRPLSS